MSYRNVPFIYIPTQFIVYDIQSNGFGYTWKTGLIYNEDIIDQTYILSKIPTYYEDEISFKISDSVVEYNNVSVKAELSPTLYECFCAGFKWIVLFLEDSDVPYTVSSLSAKVMIPMGYYDCSITLEPFKCFSVGAEKELLNSSTVEDTITFYPYPYTIGYELPSGDTQSMVIES